MMQKILFDLWKKVLLPFQCKSDNFQTKSFSTQIYRPV